MLKVTKQEAETIQVIATILMGLDEDDAYEALEDSGFESESGVYRTAFILKNVVVKMSQERRRQKALVSEAKFIQKMRKDKRFGRHFPQTEIFKVGKTILQIQEKVNMDHYDTWHMHDAVEELADRLGIEDCHEGNFGWRKGKNGPVPVFVDVDLRSRSGRKPRHRRSWM